MKLDEMVNEAKGTLEAANLPGYVKTVRTVCKAEWGARPAARSPPRPLRSGLTPPRPRSVRGGGDL